MSSPIVFAGVQRIAMPRFDRAYMTPINDPDQATTAFQVCEQEMYPDMIRWANIEKLQTEGNTIISSPGFHFCYLAINTRDYVPDDAEQPDAGRELAPLNWSSFRYGLTWSALDSAQKEAAILTIYGGPVNTATDTVVPPALGVWHDPTVVAPGNNFTKAWEGMQAGGFYIVGDTLYQPNDVAVRDEIGVMSPVEAPTSVDFTQEFVDQWNNFFGTFLGVTNCFMRHDIVEFMATLVPSAFLYRNFDLYFLCWGLGRFPDYIYDFYHSINDYPWGNNTPGINDPTLDDLLYTVKFGLVYSEKLDACHDAQYRMIEELSFIVPIYSRTYYCAFKDYDFYTGGGDTKALTNMVNSYGYGPDNFWTWNLMHWNTNTSGGTLRYILGDAPVSLNPGWAESAYEWDIVGNLLDGLTAVTPDLSDLPWMACDWTVELFDWPPLNIYDGTKVTFGIRDGATWHDGMPVTVEDIQFAFGKDQTTGFIRNFPQYAPIFNNITWTEIIDPCHISVYLNVTSQFMAYDLAGLALAWPEHIYNHNCTANPTVDPVNGATWEYTYLEWQGVPPISGIPDLTGLIGSGSYYFVEWNEPSNYVLIKKNPNYWVDVPLKQNFIAPQRVEPDEEFEYYCSIINAGSKDESTGELAPAIIDFIEITVDGDVIFVIPGPIVINPFEYVNLGPYYYTFTTKGEHYLDCHTYEDGELIDEYEHPIWVTIDADLPSPGADDYNFVIDIFDIVVVAAAFGSSPGDANWDSRADIVKDYLIDIFDIVVIAGNFGWA
jgi:ABC-type transport system substrate-binding protein